MRKKTRILSITSGKGGVGKTTLITNMALALAAAGERVLIFDGDFGMANVDIFFGVRQQGTIADVISGKKSMKEVIINVSPNIDLLPGGSGIYELSKINNYQRRSLLDSVADLPQHYSTMLIDTAPGIAENVLFMNSAADQTAVVLTPDPASFADSYALIKVLHQRHQMHKFTLLMNQVRDEQEGHALYKKFQDVMGRFLDVVIEPGGIFIFDNSLRRANQAQRLILRQDPLNATSRAISRFAAEWIMAGQRQDRGNEIKGGLQPFWRQVVGIA
jgi:flagellar biosynthesis protein FlhG